MSDLNKLYLAKQELNNKKLLSSFSEEINSIINNFASIIKIKHIDDNSQLTMESLELNEEFLIQTRTLNIIKSFSNILKYFSDIKEMIIINSVNKTDNDQWDNKRKDIEQFKNEANVICEDTFDTITDILNQVNSLE